MGIFFSASKRYWREWFRAFPKKFSQWLRERARLVADIAFIIFAATALLFLASFWYITGKISELFEKRFLMTFA